MLPRGGYMFSFQFSYGILMGVCLVFGVDFVANLLVRARRTAGLAVTLLQALAHKGKADVFFDESQQVGLRNLIVQAEVVEQGSERSCCPIMISRPPADENPTEHGQDHSAEFHLLISNSEATCTIDRI
jgi:hypothetical protein